MTHDQVWFVVQALVYSVDVGLIFTMTWWGWQRNKWTHPQMLRFLVLGILCAQRTYVGFRVAANHSKWEWDISGTTLGSGILCLLVMVWSWYYNAREWARTHPRYQPPPA